VRVVFRSPVDASRRLEEKTENDRKLNALLFAPQDYAIIGRVSRHALKTRAVLVLGVQSPFARGGAELHVRRLTDELRARGVDADLVTMPLVERERFDLVRSAAAWRSLDLARRGPRGRRRDRDPLPELRGAASRTRSCG
jgi:hypothetical protein